METVWKDVQYAARTLAKSPGFGAVAILTLGVGIGANVAVFSVVHAFLLRPLPFAQPDTLVHIWQTDIARPEFGDSVRVSVPNYADWRAQATVFSDLAAYYHLRSGQVGEHSPPATSGALPPVVAHTRPVLSPQNPRVP